ncbi:RUS1 family protein C16orf58 homolog [Seminavis robusta]|uniref:RUS1 family protein C16orf58 homolog n=1 Tax=Seminavis robusta TaxID=568900 RepID=A0A9N8E098_9STRA|nr:RUS1 family protein C16orf58 homolog [Seminavis robusta]|eukprot:Sro521_g159380.1 RUS1 family protein C16orf58 homolog (517) ;mRNA; f:36269-37900
MAMKFHIQEYDEDPILFQGDQGTSEKTIPRREYQLDLSSSSVKINQVTTTTHQSTWNALLRTPKQVLIDLFLPLGFPHSVDSSYLPYQFYDSLQGLCSYLRGVVSTSAVLAAAGVGNADATAMGAAMTWAMKDGMGMIGGLVFSYYASPHFDAYVLEFRLFADLINDVALTLDMLAPLVPSSCLLALMSASTLSKTMCGMSAGATKSSITCHLALEGNMADLNAKEGTQETLVSLVGMILGVQLAAMLKHLAEEYEEQPLTLYDTIPHEWQVPVEFAMSWTVFLFFTWLHMWANYRGVKLLKLNTLNRERATVALEALVAAMAHSYDEDPNSDAAQLLMAQPQLLPGPNDIEESMIRSTYTLLFPRRQSIVLGVSIMDILKCMKSSKSVNDILQPSVDPESLIQEFSEEKYIVGIVQKNKREYTVKSTLRNGAGNSDELKAFVHCMLLRKCLDRSPQTDDTLQMIKTTRSQLDGLFGSKTGSLLMKQLSDRGWDMEARLYLGFGRQRTSWESSKSD